MDTRLLPFVPGDVPVKAHDYNALHFVSDGEIAITKHNLSQNFSSQHSVTKADLTRLLTFMQAMIIGISLYKKA